MKDRVVKILEGYHRQPYQVEATTHHRRLRRPVDYLMFSYRYALLALYSKPFSWRRLSKMKSFGHGDSYVHGEPLVSDFMLSLAIDRFTDYLRQTKNLAASPLFSTRLVRWQYTSATSDGDRISTSSFFIKIFLLDKTVYFRSVSASYYLRISTKH